MSRHIVCMTYEFDALSIPIARGKTTPTALSRGEFGLVGAERILDLLKHEAIPGTWFIPGHTLESFPKACEPIAAAGHEIGHHGWTHRHPASLTAEEEVEELRRANDAIEKLSGQRARGYRSPAWNLSDRTLGLLIEHGFRYDSSMMGHDYLPYWVRQGDRAELMEPASFGEPASLLEMPISWSLDDFPHFEYPEANTGLKAASGVLENWTADFDYMSDHYDWGVITYTFHPFVSGRGHRMTIMARLITHLKTRGAIFMTMEQAAEEARVRLESGDEGGA
ncbi:polysaccharide deacetylase family protein [Candidatus Entotheonella palauensis]|uniref:Polysaccharide deacetylase n=1 Tax=Candidatus Entotheonella gemina TaxID=1429439 RepID=W4M6Y1_9BACT|nr:polysaccharide deacetylase [Candidatus Entotheonella palauensis]ETX05691.1 MAG: polysaccharide deacetylase [Candidatus Entotheonella gemina]